MAEKKTPARKTAVPKVKQEALEAYAEQVPRVEERREAELKPEERIAEKAARKVVETSDAVSLEGVEREIGLLKSEVGRALATLTERLAQEVSRYQALKEAIAVKDKELQEIYEIQRSASTLAALLEAQHARREEFEADLAERRDALTQEMESQRASWAQERAARQAEEKERAEVESRRRQREQEEFSYALSREQQLARDRFEDEKAKHEEELGRLEREIELRREQSGKELAEREQAVKQAEDELRELRARAAAFPKELETAVAREVKAAVERARNEAASRDELLRKEFDGERNVLKTRIAALEGTVKEQAEQVAKLQQQLERSYAQIQDIAVKAIQGASSRGLAMPAAAPEPAKSQG